MPNIDVFSASQLLLLTISENKRCDSILLMPMCKNITLPRTITKGLTQNPVSLNKSKSLDLSLKLLGYGFYSLTNKKIY